MTVQTTSHSPLRDAPLSSWWDLSFSASGNLMGQDVLSWLGRGLRRGHTACVLCSGREGYLRLSEHCSVLKVFHSEQNDTSGWFQCVKYLKSWISQRQNAAVIIPHLCTSAVTAPGIRLPACCPPLCCVTADMWGRWRGRMRHFSLMFR